MTSRLGVVSLIALLTLSFLVLESAGADAATANANLDLFVANSASSSISVIDLHDNEIKNVPVGGSPWSIAVSPDGNYAYVTIISSDTVSVIDTASDTVVDTIRVGKHPAAVVFDSANGRAYVANAESDTISVIDVETEHVVHTIRNIGVEPYALALSSRSPMLYVADVDEASNANSSVTVVNLHSNTVIKKITPFDGAEGLAVAPDDDNLYVTDISDSDLSVVGLPRGNISTRPVGLGPQGIALSHGGSDIWVANSGESSVSVISRTANTSRIDVAAGLGPAEIAFNPSGSRAYVTDYRAATVSVIDVATRKLIGRFPVGSTPHGIAVAAIPNLNGPRRSTIATSLTTPAGAFSSTFRTVVNAAIAAGSVLFIAFPAQLFNQTFQDNYPEIELWWRKRLDVVRSGRWKRRARGTTGSDGHEPSRRTRIATAGLVVLLGGLLGSLLDPSFALNEKSEISYLAIVASTTLGIAIPAIVVRVYRKRVKEPTSSKLTALPAGLLVAIGCLVVSRVANFQPGYLYGVVCGVSFTHALGKRRQGHTVALATIATLSIAVLAWIVFASIERSAARIGAPWPLVFADDLLAAIFTGGIVGVTIGSFPLRFLPGGALAAWHRGAWAVTFAVVAFAFVEVMLDPGRGGHAGHGALVTIVVLFVLFGGGSIAFYEHFRRRKTGQ